MEAIINYSLKEFLAIEDVEIILQYMDVLDCLLPVREVPDPIYKDFPPIKIKPVKSLSFGSVTSLRQAFKSGNIEAVCSAVATVTELRKDETFLLPIIDFYGIISSIKRDLEMLINMEINALTDEDDDPIMIEINASERMSKFETLNLINSLANGDVTKWHEVEKLPYMVVFTKLVMDKERADIDKDIRLVQERKNKNK